MCRDCNKFTSTITNGYSTRIKSKKTKNMARLYANRRAAMLNSLSDYRKKKRAKKSESLTNHARLKRKYSALKIHIYFFFF